MVTILRSDKRTKTVDIQLTMKNIYDIINGLNILVGLKEDEMNKYGAEFNDKDQYERYKVLLKDMQQVKGLFK